MENDEEQQKFDILKIFIKTLEHISLSYYKQYNLDKIVNAVENLDIDDFIVESGDAIIRGANNIVDTFVNSWVKNIQDKLEEQKNKIKNNPEQDQAKIDEQLKKIPNIGDIRKEDFVNYQKFIKEELIDKIGLKTEEEIEIFLKNYVDNVIKKSINDATASLPLTLAQLLASIFPLGTEPLVAVNTINNMATGITDNMAVGLVDTLINKTGGRRKKRKSKSKHFYINRIKRTLKYFYNY